MRVLVTGREGQVVRALLERGAGVPGLELIAVGRPELDLTVPGSGAAVVRRIAPDVVINAAAYTAVDQAEDEPELAMRVNGEAAGELAEAARDLGAPIIQLSTDYVFDGRKPEPYVEEDPVGPIGVYGRSKLLGEERVRASNPDHLILRTAWVYSPWGRNFVKTMLTLARTRREVGVVTDQKGSPTSASDIADAIFTVLRAWSAGDSRDAGRTLHVAGSGTATWFEFAVHIFSLAVRYGLPSAMTRPILTSDYPTKAGRPACSMLDSSAFLRRFGYRSPEWRASSVLVVERLAASGP